MFQYSGGAVGIYRTLDVPKYACWDDADLAKWHSNVFLYEQCLVLLMKVVDSELLPRNGGNQLFHYSSEC